MFDVLIDVAAIAYFLYPAVFAYLRKEEKPILLGASVHGINFSVLLLCGLIYSPVYIWLTFLAPQLDDFGYLRHISWIFSVFRALEEYAPVFILLVGVFVTPFLVCKRAESSESPDA